MSIYVAAHPPPFFLVHQDPIYAFLDPGPLANVYLPFVSSRTPSVELRGRKAEVNAEA